MEIRNYYSSTVTVMLEDGIKHVKAGEIITVSKKDGKRLLKNFFNRFEKVEEESKILSKGRGK